jgi:hypothetical protein
MTPTGKVYQKRAGKKEDYGDTNAKWSAAFLLWTAIRVVYSKDIDLFLKLHRFHAKIIRLSETYTWEGVLKLAVHLHTIYYNDAEASWLVPDEERDARCIRKPSPAVPHRNPRIGQIPHTSTSPAVTQAFERQIAPGQVCYSWNKGRCREPCPGGRIHNQCSQEGCNEKHSAHLFHK